MKEKILEFLKSNAENDRFIVKRNLTNDEIINNIINLEKSRLKEKYEECSELPKDFPSGILGLGWNGQTDYKYLKSNYENPNLISYIIKKLQLKKSEITVQSILDYCDKRKSQMSSDWISVHLYLTTPREKYDKKQKELQLQIENAIANDNSIEFMVELSSEGINDCDLWKHKIQFAGNNSSCWWADRGCYQASSEWFDHLQINRQAVAIYFYRKSIETNNNGYIIDNLWTLSGRVWCIKDDNGCLQFFNPYYKFGEKSELIRLLGTNDRAPIEVHGNIYVNEESVFCYDKDSINTDFIYDSCAHFFGDIYDDGEEDGEEEESDQSIFENWENNEYCNAKSDIMIPNKKTIKKTKQQIKERSDTQLFYNRFIERADLLDIAFSNTLLAFSTFWLNDFYNPVRFFDHIWHYDLSGKVGILKNFNWDNRIWERELFELIR